MIKKYYYSAEGKIKIKLASSGHSEDAYIMYNGVKYTSGNTIYMKENDTCTLYVLPNYATWNNITSSYRLPFMGFVNNYGTISNYQILSNEYICATYTVSSSDDVIAQFYGSVNASIANIQIGYPQIKSSNSSPFIDNSVEYIYLQSPGSSVKGDGYFISNTDIISDSVNIIEANFQWNHGSSSHYNYTLKSDGTCTPSWGSLTGANVKGGTWGSNTNITVSITIPANSSYEFVKWKIDRMEADYRNNPGGSGIFPLYRNDFGNYGNDYFEKYYNTVFTQDTCSIPWLGCHTQITPILQLKTT